jgi:hypothetical protein
MQSMEVNVRDQVYFQEQQEAARADASGSAAIYVHLKAGRWGGAPVAAMNGGLAVADTRLAPTKAMTVAQLADRASKHPTPLKIPKHKISAFPSQHKLFPES